jgi:Gas vesicle synthesis protein GvpL/GvpF
MAAERGLPAWSEEEVQDLLSVARAEAYDQVKQVVRETLARDLAARVEAIIGDPATGRGRLARRPTSAEKSAGTADEAAVPAGSGDVTDVTDVRHVSQASHTTQTSRAKAAREGAPLWYAYAVLAAEDVPALGDLEPVKGGNGVTGIEHEGLVAVASPVPAGEYSAEALMSGLNNREWLERVAFAHERVLAALLPRALVPFRLCTVFSAPERVAEMLSERGEALRDALRRVDGRVELGVKVVADPAALLRAAAAAGQPTDATGDDGTAYLAARQRQREADLRARDLGARLASCVHARLAGLASDAVRGRPQRRELTGDRDWMLLNGSYLIETARTDAFASEVGRLSKRFEPAGVRMTLTGPWAPYNFTFIGEEGKP